MKNFTRHNSHGCHGLKRRELAQHAHSHYVAPIAIGSNIKDILPHRRLHLIPRCGAQKVDIINTVTVPNITIIIIIKHICQLGHERWSHDSHIRKTIVLPRPDTTYQIPHRNLIYRTTRYDTETLSQRTTRYYTETLSYRTTRYHTDTLSQRTTRYYTETLSQRTTRYYTETLSQRTTRYYTETLSQRTTRYYTETLSYRTTRYHIVTYRQHDKDRNLIAENGNKTNRDSRKSELWNIFDKTIRPIWKITSTEYNYSDGDTMKTFIYFWLTRG